MPGARGGTPRPCAASRRRQPARSSTPACAPWGSCPGHPSRHLELGHPVGGLIVRILVGDALDPLLPSLWVSRPGVGVAMYATVCTDLVDPYTASMAPYTWVLGDSADDLNG